MSLRFLHLFILIALVGSTIWLWNTPALYLIKLFVVLLHEISHGLAAVLTGGEILRIEVNELIGGYCQYRGGNRFVVASAGYLGSLLWGGVILIVASRTDYSPQLGTFIAAVMLIVTLLWIRNTFGILYTAGSAVMLFVMCRFLPQWAVRIVIQFLGTASCMYVIMDIVYDLLLYPQEGSDAHTLSQLTGIGAYFWGVLWMLIALVMILYSFYLAGSHNLQSNQSTTRPSHELG
jgi:hypothetical protein